MLKFIRVIINGYFVALFICNRRYFILFFLIAIFTPSSFQNLIRDISVCIINSTHEIDQTRVNNLIIIQRNEIFQRLIVISKDHSLPL